MNRTALAWLGGLVACLMLVGPALLARGGAGPALASSRPVPPLVPQGPTFTYQGQLVQNGNPVNGSCDFQFRLYPVPSGGSQVGSQQTANAVSVSNGLFTVPI